MAPPSPQPVAVADSDAALIAAWQRGDERAAAELVRRHAKSLARFLAGAGGASGEIDDLVQESFIRAFRGLDRFRGQCRFRTWLFTIGGNVLRDAGRKAGRGRAVPLAEDLRAELGEDGEEPTPVAEEVGGVAHLPGTEGRELSS